MDKSRLHDQAPQPKEAATCPPPASASDILRMEEAELLLSEKRTYLAAMRIGIAVLTLPLAVLGVLIATSRHYQVLQMLPLMVALAVMLVVLIILSGYLIVGAVRNLHRYDRLMRQLGICQK